MKKYIVLGVLFILPIAVYLFFASGVNNFGKLPVLNEQVQDVSSFSSEGNKVSLHGKITVLGFLGQNVSSKKLNAFNLNQKIYKRFNGFKDFQFVFIIDKEVNHRGRLIDDHTNRELYGYDATSVAVLNNKMIDDIKVLLAEYRMATKKNGVSDKESYLKYNKKSNEE